MFDNITIHPSMLPVSEEERHLFDDETFQTKDLLCFLNDYEITTDGRIMLVNEMFGGWNYREAYKPVDFHGWLNFYAIVGDGFWEFSAKFTDGVMTEIHKV